MSELKRLAEKYHLEGELYHTLGGQGKVRQLMGSSRYMRFCKKNLGLNMSNQEEWDKITISLERELELCQDLFAKEKAYQPLCSAIVPEMPDEENPETVENTVDHGWNKGHTNVSIRDKFKATCGICGTTDHKSYVSPFSG